MSAEPGSNRTADAPPSPGGRPVSPNTASRPPFRTIWRAETNRTPPKAPRRGASHAPRLERNWKLSWALERLRGSGFGRPRRRSSSFASASRPHSVATLLYSTIGLQCTYCPSSFVPCSPSPWRKARTSKTLEMKMLARFGYVAVRCSHLPRNRTRTSGSSL